MEINYTFADLISQKFKRNFDNETANQIVLPIKGNRYLSIVQNDKNAPRKSKLGMMMGDYGEQVEVAILDSNFNVVDDENEYVKGYIRTEELALLLIRLT
tara:strand:+ start:4194 stop:4493 length:300 start_codon:yes stop_codon:yes gene_type:complete